MTTQASDTEDPVARAWSQLLDRSDAIADVISGRMMAQHAAAYERIGPHIVDDVRHSSREHIGRGLAILAGRLDARSAVELWRETGRRRARQGVPLELVLNAYTMGARVLWESLMELASSAPGPDGIDDKALLQAARGVWSDLDVQNGVLIDAYHRESARLLRRDQQRQQTVLDGLLDGRGADQAFTDEARGLFEIAAGDRVACVVALSDGPHTDAAGAVEDRLERHGIRTRWHVRSGAAFGLLAGPLPGEDALVDLIGSNPPGRVGVAASADGLAGFATAFQLALRAAQTLPRAHCGVVAVTARLPEVLLAGDSHVTPLLVAQTLGPLLEHGQAETLLATLSALLRHDGSPTHAAAELFCHRNTVIYRMKQIERLTGRDLTDPRDKMLLWLALMAG